MDVAKTSSCAGKQPSSPPRQIWRRRCRPDLEEDEATGSGGGRSYRIWRRTKLRDGWGEGAAALKLPDLASFTTADPSTDLSASHLGSGCGFSRANNTSKPWVHQRLVLHDVPPHWSSPAHPRQLPISQWQRDGMKIEREKRRQEGERVAAGK
jgi:hypothetical protein